MAAGTAAVTAERTVGDDQEAIVADSAAPLARDVPAESAVDDGQGAAVADGATDFRAVVLMRVGVLLGQL